MNISLIIKFGNDQDKTEMVFTIDDPEMYGRLVDALAYTFKQFLDSHEIAHDYNIKPTAGEKPVFSMIRDYEVEP
jgi:hypothetical protein